MGSDAAGGLWTNGNVLFVNNCQWHQSTLAQVHSLPGYAVQKQAMDLITSILCGQVAETWKNPKLHLHHGHRTAAWKTINPDWNIQWKWYRKQSFSTWFAQIPICIHTHIHDYTCAYFLAVCWHPFWSYLWRDHWFFQMMVSTQTKKYINILESTGASVNFPLPSTQPLPPATQACNAPLVEIWLWNQRVLPQPLGELTALHTGTLQRHSSSLLLPITFWGYICIYIYINR